MGRFSLGFEFRGARSHSLQIGLLRRDEPGIAYLAVTWNNRAWLKGFESSQDRQPIFPAGVLIGKDREETIDYHIAGKKELVLFHVDRGIAASVSRTNQKQPSCHSAPIDFNLAVEEA